MSYQKIQAKSKQSKNNILVSDTFGAIPQQQEQLRDIAFETPESNICPRVYDISYQLPKWMKFRKEESPEDFLLLDFLQSYYDWLYCKEEGSHYPLTYNEIQKIFGGESSSFNEIKHFASSYFSAFPKSKLNETSIDLDNFIDFLNGIRIKFYQYKGNEQSYVHFLSTLYGITGEDIKVETPKTKVMRLNGGRFSGWGAGLGSTGSYEEVTSLGGAYLNYSVFRDSYFYQDYSYAVKTGRDEREYSLALKEVLHPAGLQPFFETSIADYVPTGGPFGDSDEGSLVCESPIIAHYASYSLESTADMNPCYGCNGNALNTEIYPPDGSDYDLPTFKHPGWALNCTTVKLVDGFLYYDCDFGSLNIIDFLYLCGENPNDEIPTCSDLVCPG